MTDYFRQFIMDYTTMCIPLIEIIKNSDEDADDPIEDEHHVIFACSGYVNAKQLFPDLFSQATSTVGHFLSQPDPTV